MVPLVFVPHGPMGLIVSPGRGPSGPSLVTPPQYMQLRTEGAVSQLVSHARAHRSGKRGPWPGGLGGRGGRGGKPAGRGVMRRTHYEVPSLEQNSSSHLERGAGATVMTVEVTNVVSVGEVDGNGLAVQGPPVVPSGVELLAHGSDEDELSMTVVP